MLSRVICSAWLRAVGSTGRVAAASATVGVGWGAERPAEYREFTGLFIVRFSGAEARSASEGTTSAGLDPSLARRAGVGSLAGASGWDWSLAGASGWCWLAVATGGRGGRGLT